MSNGRTSFQHYEDAGQPYTRIAADKKFTETTTPDGQPGLIAEDCYTIFGYTLEEKLQPDTGDDPEWKREWEQHDLGQQPTLEDAFKVAADWRGSLCGVYEVR